MKFLYSTEISSCLHAGKYKYKGKWMNLYIAVLWLMGNWNDETFNWLI